MPHTTKLKRNLLFTNSEEIQPKNTVFCDTTKKGIGSLWQHWNQYLFAILRLLIVFIWKLIFQF